MPTSRIDIDLSAIDRNLATIRQVVTPPNGSGPGAATSGAEHRARGAGVCAIVKQDGYGLGAARIAKRLGAAGADMLGVYSLDEARALAEAVARTPILVLMPVYGLDRMDPLYRQAAIGRLHLTLHNADQFEALSEMTSHLGATLPVHVQVDTGMSRGGVMPDLAQELVDKVLSSPSIRLAGLMTHFASPCCDEKVTREQARTFRDFVENVKPAIRAFVAGQPKGAPAGDLVLHAANSCAAFRSRNLHGSMVRVGQALLGYVAEDAGGPGEFEFAAQARALEPAVRWTTSLVHIADVPPGWPVGYGSIWRAPQRSDGKRTRIGLVPVGYADGYPRSLGGKVGAVVGFTGRPWDRRVGDGDEPVPARPTKANRSADTSSLPTVYAPVVGRVSMDQITVDVTDVPEAYLRFSRPGHGHEPVGPEVEIFSRSRGAPNFLPTLAAAAGTITHELLTRIGPRVERVYRTGAKQHSVEAHAPPPPASLRLTAGSATGGAPTMGAVAR